jgi:hypothetical protein
MKIEITMKDPDCLEEPIDEAVKASLADLGLDADEMEPLIEKRTEKIREKMNHWFEYGEYVTIIVDTDAMTATVKERP